MIKHLVSWKLDDSYSESEKETVKKEVKFRLLGLEGQIEGLKKIQVFFNSPEAPAANYDILLDTEFESIDGLNAYQVHPKHVEVVQFVKTLKLQRSCIDYEF